MIKKNILLSIFSCVSAFCNYACAETTDTLQNIVTTGTRNATDNRHIPASVATITRTQIDDSHSSSLIPTIMEQAPGMFSTGIGHLGYGVNAGAMKFRGIGGTTDMLVLIDGQPMYAGLTGQTFPDTYLSMMADKVEVLRGPASLYYGSNAMGGVINIITRQQKDDGMKTSLQLQGGSFGTIIAEGSNSYRKGKFSSFIGINYGKTDGHRPNSDFNQFGTFAKVGYDIDKNWNASANVDVTHFSSTNPGAESAPLYDAAAHVTRGFANISLSNDYGFTRGNIRAYYNWGHHEESNGYRVGVPTPQYTYKHNDLLGGLSINQSATFWEGGTVTVGFDWQHFGGEAWNDYRNGGRKDFDKIENQNEIAGYVDIRQDILTWLTLDAGVRYDHHSQSGNEFIPQGGLSYHIDRTTDLKLMASKGFRNPTIYEMYMYYPNPSLKPEEIISIEASLSKRFANGEVEGSIFHIDANDLIEFGVNRFGAGFLQQNIGEFQSWGFELRGNYRFNKHFHINANYSFLNMKEPVIGAPEHKLFIQGKYSIGKLSVLADIQHIHGLYTYIEDENEDIENYTLLNLSANYDVLPYVSLFVKGNNILGQSYQTIYGFHMPKASVMGGVKIDF